MIPKGVIQFNLPFEGILCTIIPLKVAALWAATLIGYNTFLSFCSKST